MLLPSRLTNNIIILCKHTRRFSTEKPSVSELIRKFRPSKRQISKEKSRILALMSNDVDDQPKPQWVNEFLQRGNEVDVIDQADFENWGELEEYNYDAILVHQQTAIDSTALNSLPDVKVIGIPENSTGSVDLMAATKKSIVVLNTNNGRGGGTQVSVEAELTLKAILQLAQQENTFKIFGKVLGIVGLIDPSLQVAKLAKALGMEVIGYDPSLAEEAAAVMGIRKASEEETYSRSDFILLTAPLTSKTRGMFNDDVLSMCKEGVKLIIPNDAGIINASTLSSGIASKHIAGIAMDKTDQGDDSSCIIDTKTIHDADSVKNEGEDINVVSYKEIAQKMCHALTEKQYNGVVNAVYLPLSTEPAMKAFISLAQDLGRLQAQYVGSSTSDPIREIKIATDGGKDIDITTPKAKSLLLAAVTKGVLDTLRSEEDEVVGKCSLINATLLAMQKGIRAQVGELESSDVELGLKSLNNALTVHVATESGADYVVVGSVFGEEPRIVQMGNHHEFPPFKPEGTLLFFNNEDRPGAIAGILKVLAEAQVNVANLGLARYKTSSGEAFGILTLDDQISDDTMGQLQSLESVRNIKIAQFSGTHLKP